jgi:hypothetical protein
MHAVVFEVEMKDGWEKKVDQELDFIVGSLRELPGFTRGTWLTDGHVGVSLVLFESKEVAQRVADSAVLPPDASATLRSARALDVVREA